jgi:alanine dehydrogenase
LEVAIIKNQIGIRREDKNRWERRTPLTPDDIRKLKHEFGIQTIIQPSNIRIYSDDEYRQAGAIAQEDLSSCPVVFGVKEMPSSFFQPKNTYVFFYHTIKGQKYNMPTLKRMMTVGCNLIDYEKIVNEKGHRLLFFGRYAGLAGMIDSLWAVGKRLDWEGIPNPFSSLLQTYEYESLEEAEKAVARVGKKIQSESLSSHLLPFVCGFTGYGHVSQGAQEIFDLLPHREIAPEDIPRVFNSPGSSKDRLYKVVFEEQHLMKPIAPNSDFDLQDYYNHPEKYKSKFESYLPYLTLIINAIYWSPAYPKIVTKRGLKKLFNVRNKPRLRVIGDISCDVEGAIECTVRITQPDKPIFTYDPVKDREADGYEGPGVIIMAVDNLPCELPRASSVYFSKNLMRFAPEIAHADFSVDFGQLKLSPQIKNGLVLYGGQLTPQYSYLDKYLL